jgi:predicted cobalt transporter CbtA
VTAAVLASTGFVVAFVVPFTKYPTNPPSIGDPDTIVRRTELYAAMVAVSILAAVAAYRFGRSLVARLGGWNAALCGAALYLAVVAVAEAVLPGVHETPSGFSADVLWRFRVASLGVQAILWATLGIVFGALAERALARRPSPRVVDYSST